jgi:hypothetical protein
VPDVPVIAEAVDHDLVPHIRHGAGGQASRRRRTGEPKARKRRSHDSEGVRGVSAMSRRIAEQRYQTRNSQNEPGHPCVSISGSGLGPAPT